MCIRDRDDSSIAYSLPLAHHCPEVNIQPVGKSSMNPIQALKAIPTRYKILDCLLPSRYSQYVFHIYSSILFSNLGLSASIVPDHHDEYLAEEILNCRYCIGQHRIVEICGRINLSKKGC